MTQRTFRVVCPNNKAVDMLANSKYDVVEKLLNVDGFTRLGDYTASNRGQVYYVVDPFEAETGQISLDGGFRAQVK